MLIPNAIGFLKIYIEDQIKYVKYLLKISLFKLLCILLKNITINMEGLLNLI